MQADCLGHERLWGLFETLIDSGKLGHAYLFVGPTYVGKMAFMESLATRLLNTERARLESHPDLIRLIRETDEKTEKRRTHLSVKQIRDLSARLSLNPLAGGKQVVLIEEASRLNSASANALLKTLEEVGAHALLLLRASRVDDVPQTIASRCQIMHLSLVPDATIRTALVKRGASISEAEEIARVALGRPELAFTLLTDRSSWSRLVDLRQALSRAIDLPAYARLALAKNLAPKESETVHEDTSRVLDAWEIELRDHLVGSRANASLRSLQALTEARVALAHHVQPQFVFEHFLLSL